MSTLTLIDFHFVLHIQEQLSINCTACAALVTGRLLFLSSNCGKSPAFSAHSETIESNTMSTLTLIDFHFVLHIQEGSCLDCTACAGLGTGRLLFLSSDCGKFVCSLGQFVLSESNTKRTLTILKFLCILCAQEMTTICCCVWNLREPIDPLLFVLEIVAKSQACLAHEATKYTLLCCYLRSL